MAARAVGKPLPHDSAHLHVAGTAAYTDDLPEPRDLLHLAVGMSRVAHGRLRDLELDDVLAVDGVVDVMVAGDIPGENNYGSIVKDDPVLADGLVQYVGQPVFVVAATTVDAARCAARKARMQWWLIGGVLAVAVVVTIVLISVYTEGSLPTQQGLSSQPVRPHPPRHDYRCRHAQDRSAERSQPKPARHP